jgi:hypothetical protein
VENRPVHWGEGVFQKRWFVVSLGPGKARFALLAMENLELAQHEDLERLVHEPAGVLVKVRYQPAASSEPIPVLLRTAGSLHHPRRSRGTWSPSASSRSPSRWSYGRLDTADAGNSLVHIRPGAGAASTSM